MTRASGWRPAVVAGLLALGVASVGGSLTVLGPWYYSLQQPAWKPPDWAFGPAWTLIFELTAAAGAIGWRRGTSAQRRAMLGWFALNAGLNVFWSLLFFKLQRPDWSLWEIGPLWLSVLAMVWHLRGYAPRASMLLWPYLAWVTFAASVNWGVVQLNGPFGAG